jgi:PTS system nitrogen regulatory IIA component
MKAIFEYMDEKLIFFLSANSRDEALRTLVDLTAENIDLPNPEAFYQAICDREKLISTGIGMGVAIPHAKMPEYEHFFITIGILQKGVDWHALDQTPVRMIFLIGGPDDKQTEYLQVLSHLTLLIKNEEIRKKMLTLNSKRAILDLFK